MQKSDAPAQKFKDGLYIAKNRYGKIFNIGYYDAETMQALAQIYNFTFEPTTPREAMPLIARAGRSEWLQTCLQNKQMQDSEHETDRQRRKKWQRAAMTEYKKSKDVQKSIEAAQAASASTLRLQTIKNYIEKEA